MTSEIPGELAGEMPAATSRVRLAAARLALVVAALSLVGLAAGPLGYRAGLLGYRIGLVTLVPWSGIAALAAAGVALLTLLLALRPGPRRGALLGASLLAILLAAPAGGVWLVRESLTGSFAPINDITTDPATPPEFAATVAARTAEGARSAYDPAFAAQQHRFYPDIAPVATPLAPAEAFARVRAVADRLGWQIIAADPAKGTLEASERSTFFGFTDDIAIRVAASGGGSRIDIRSAARIGRGDWGVNAKRVRRFVAALKEQLPHG